jgi:type IV pilus assembly protein PilN
VVRKDYSYLFDPRILVSTFALLGLGAAYLIGQQFFASNLATKQADLQEVQQEISANSYVQSKIKELETLRDEKTAKNQSLKSISVSKRKWVRVLEGVNRSMPLNTWLETVKQNESNEQEVEIKGKTFVFPEVAEYMMELEKNEYFQEINLLSIEFQQENERSSFSFTLKIQMNPNVGIDNFALDSTPEKVL